MVSSNICWGSKNYFLNILHVFKKREIVPLNARVVVSSLESLC